MRAGSNISSEGLRRLECDNRSAPSANGGRGKGLQHKLALGRGNLPATPVCRWCHLCGPLKQERVKPWLP